MAKEYPSWRFHPDGRSEVAEHAKHGAELEKKGYKEHPPGSPLAEKAGKKAKAKTAAPEADAAPAPAKKKGKASA